uniref:Uncharacterized protein n=1 Tax=Aegilops tauschii subsp. strangulata TaxID=200361 RepID=A0A453HSK5_AEGTS
SSCRLHPQPQQPKYPTAPPLLFLRRRRANLEGSGHGGHPRHVARRHHHQEQA